MHCPCCKLQLEPFSVYQEIVAQCGGCGGQFASHETLSQLLAALASIDGERGRGYSRPSPLSDPVRYRKCPACREIMQRKNFTESSGVVIDVCPAHGSWFDRGELMRICQFAASGAMSRAEKERTTRIEGARRRNQWERDLRAAGPRHYISAIGGPLLGPVEWIADTIRLPANSEPKRKP
jgi:Zn-finger nucleic acid-binding protein